jgi:two-component system OmpR family sensor kinase
MSRLVEDLLTLARLDEARQSGGGPDGTGRIGGAGSGSTTGAGANPVPAPPVNLSPLVMETVRDIQVATPGHQWSFVVPEEPAEVFGEETALRQVMLNLLGNAAKHTPAGTTVHTALSREPDGSCLLKVSDNGPGIDPAFQKIIFDRFSRADQARTGTTGSTGLGLSIVKAIVQSHGGTVGVASTPGRTTFTVQLPGPERHTGGQPPTPGPAECAARGNS